MIFPEIQLYLSKYCLRNQRYGFKKLTDFRLWLEQANMLTDVKEIKKLHATHYFRDIINARQIREIVKKKYFQVIMGYLRFLYENELIPEKIEISTPKFSDYISQQVVERIHANIPDRADLVALMRQAHKTNPAMFVYLVLLCHNGMRDSECRSILIENIKFEMNTIFTGLVEEHAKEGLCIYFIPEGFGPMLKSYIEGLQRVYNNPKYLFHSHQSDRGFISRASVVRNLQRYKRVLKLSCPVNPHTVRDSLNEYRLGLKCNDGLMAILLNQKPVGTNALFYLKRVKNNLNARYLFWKEYTWSLLPEVFSNIP